MWAKQTSNQNNSRGFTIVELLIVIVVIGILATITIVAYTNVQQKARDAGRKSDFRNVATALRMYYQDNGNYITTGGGTDLGTGWFNEGAGGSSISILKTLQNTNYLVAKNVIDPKCGLGTYSSVCPGYLKGNCIVNGVNEAVLMAKLESEPPLAAPALLSSCGSALGWWNTYGLNYMVEVN